jgi:molecular chaperone GrpE
MNRQVRVPIRVRHPADGSRREVEEKQPPVVEPEPAIVEQGPISAAEKEPVASVSPKSETGPSVAQPEPQAQEQLREELEEWRDRALRLQAEIENFRKRQQRLAEDRVQANRERLLRSFLLIADDLERALSVGAGDNESLREGVQVTYRSLKQLLKQEGVERIEAKGKTFDPVWHEAVATVPHQKAGADQDIIVDVAQQGYRLDGRLLRPARVVVAT